MNNAMQKSSKFTYCEGRVMLGSKSMALLLENGLERGLVGHDWETPPPHSTLCLLIFQKEEEERDSEYRVRELRNKCAKTFNRESAHQQQKAHAHLWLSQCCRLFGLVYSMRQRPIQMGFYLTGQNQTRSWTALQKICATENDKVKILSSTFLHIGSNWNKMFCLQRWYLQTSVKSSGFLTHSTIEEGYRQ